MNPFAKSKARRVTLENLEQFRPFLLPAKKKAPGGNLKQRERWFQKRTKKGK